MVMVKMQGKGISINNATVRSSLHFPHRCLWLTSFLLCRKPQGNRIHNGNSCLAAMRQTGRIMGKVIFDVLFYMTATELCNEICFSAKPCATYNVR